MSDPQAAANTLQSGLDRGRLEDLLVAAEPRRRAALAASLNLIVAIVLTIAGTALWEGRYLQLLVALIIGAMLWRFCNHLWRDVAVAILAPPIGAPWGQSSIASGLAAVELETWFSDVFSHEGARFTSWRSQGTYRGVAYTLSETTLHQRRRNNRERKAIHVMVAEISVPQSFSGRVALLPKAGLMGKLDDMVRQMFDDEEQRRPIDPAFDAVFDTLASADAPVDTLLAPHFRRAMLALAARHAGVRFTARFERGWFSLRLPVQHLALDSVRLHRPLTEMVEQADALWWDLTIAHRLIDGLMGDHDGPLR